MNKPGKFVIWMAQIRANFLILAVLLVCIGSVYAFKYPTQENSLQWIHIVLLIAGVVAAHISVNLFNEYSDYRTKIDFHTKPTPFSGGSGMLTKGYTTPASVLKATIISFMVAVAVGAYFTITSHWSILVIMIVGAVAIFLYSDFLAKHLLGELIAGLTLGSLVVLGTYIAMTGVPGAKLQHLLPVEVIWISIPPGILTSLLLLLNEFPDAEADKEGGRNHLVIKLGTKMAAYIYVFGLVVTFGIIIALPLVGISSIWLYLALLPLPLAVKASILAIKYGNDTTKLLPALDSNVKTVLGTDLLLALAVFIDLF